MADPVTNNYSLVLPTVGGDTNVWGGILNNGVITALDNVLGGVLPVTITSADVTLTAAQFQNVIFVITGALTANRKLNIPLSPNSGTVFCAGRFTVVNLTTGPFTLTVGTATGGGVTVPQGFASSLYCDGTSVGNGLTGSAQFVRAVNGNPNGLIGGTAGSVNTNAQLAVDYSTGTLWVCTTTGNSATAVWSPPNLAIKRGFDTAINLQLNATVPGNNLTVTIAAADTGLAPTAVDPVTVLFRSATPGIGAPITANITSALSIATVAGASFGSVANTPFRLWYVLFYNGGTPVLGVINCSTPAGVLPLNEARLATSLTLNGASTSAGVFYTPGGPVTNSPFRILGFIEYETTTLVTPGTYTSPPDWVQLFGPGVMKPGDVVQSSYVTSPSTTVTVALANSNLVIAITPTSASNLFKIDASGVGIMQNGGQNVLGQLYRNAVALGQQIVVGLAGSTDRVSAGMSFNVLDAPHTLSSVTYAVKVQSGGGNNINFINGGMVVQEIMG